MSEVRGWLLILKLLFDVEPVQGVWRSLYPQPLGHERSELLTLWSYILCLQFYVKYQNFHSVAGLVPTLCPCVTEVFIVKNCNRQWSHQKTSTIKTPENLENEVTRRRRQTCHLVFAFTYCKALLTESIVLQQSGNYQKHATLQEKACFKLNRTWWRSPLPCIKDDASWWRVRWRR